MYQQPQPGWDFSHRQNAYQNRGDAPQTGELPPGTYQVRITGASLEATKRTGDPMFTWELTVLSGPYANRKTWKHSMLVTDDHWKYFGWDLDALGVQLTHPNVITDHAWRGQFIGVTVEITIKQNKREDGQVYTNTYFNQRIHTSQQTGQQPQYQQPQQQQRQQPVYPQIPAGPVRDTRPPHTDDLPPDGAGYGNDVPF